MRRPNGPTRHQEGTGRGSGIEGQSTSYIFSYITGPCRSNTAVRLPLQWLEPGKAEMFRGEETILVPSGLPYGLPSRCPAVQTLCGEMLGGRGEHLTLFFLDMMLNTFLQHGHLSLVLLFLG